MACSFNGHIEFHHLEMLMSAEKVTEKNEAISLQKLTSKWSSLFLKIASWFGCLTLYLEASSISH